jgi:hypothetical protein
MNDTERVTIMVQPDMDVRPLTEGTSYEWMTAEHFVALVDHIISKFGNNARTRWRSPEFGVLHITGQGRLDSKPHMLEVIWLPSDRQLFDAIKLCSLDGTEIPLGNERFANIIKPFELELRLGDRDCQAFQAARLLDSILRERSERT